MSKIDIGLVALLHCETGKPVDQMNMSVTDCLAGYVRKKVKSGRYNNASEVVREALQRMENEEKGRAGLRMLADEVKARGRRRVARRVSGE